MRAHFEYLKYVIRHKWFVFVACCKLGIPCLGIIHDLSKFSRAEWFPCVRAFYNSDGSRRPKIRDSSGAFDPTKVTPEYRLAWLHHQRNKHHWQAWIAIGDYGFVDVLPIPEGYVREMVADWIGARKATGSKGTPQKYYEANRGKMRMHQESRKVLLEVLDDHNIGEETHQADSG